MSAVSILAESWVSFSAKVQRDFSRSERAAFFQFFAMDLAKPFREDVSRERLSRW